MLLLIGVVGLVLGAAYQVLPYRYGIPLLVLFLGSWFVWLFVASQGGLSASEGEPLALAVTTGLVGWFAAMPLVAIIRGSRGRSSADA